MAHSDYLCDGLTENAVIPSGRHQNYSPRTLVDDTLEYIDPTPNVYTLFLQFNKKFFCSKLDHVEVKWSNRMTTCAGTCTFQPATRSCVITLSAPLLKLRPRKDLVETLLHEMIHGYLFITSRNRDRDGHGPEFQSHMHRINREAGTNITIYHNFHDEVKLYQQHWWRCNGPCQKQSPYFGMVRRASNRAPSKNDFWWADHQQRCGGTFIKIKEPDSFKSKKRKQSGTDNNPTKKTSNGNANISKWLDGSSDWKSPQVPKTSGKQPITKTPNVHPGSIDLTKGPYLKDLGLVSNVMNGKVGSKTPSNSKQPPKNVSSGIMKLGNKTNTVHGWGTGGPGSTSSSSVPSNKPVNKPNVPSPSTHGKFSFSGTLGGSSTGKSNLLDKFLSSGSTSTNKPIKEVKKSGGTAGSSSKDGILEVKVQCPICQKMVVEEKINNHVDACLSSNETSVQGNAIKKVQNTQPVVIEDDDTSCPVCGKRFKLEAINAHLDRCLNEPHTSNDAKSRNSNTRSSQQKCLICNEIIDANSTLNEHLDNCIGDLFNDEMISTSNEDVTDQGSKFPCPVCMAMIEGSNMNRHLDTCLRF